MGFPKPQLDGKPGILIKVLKNSYTDVIVLNLKIKSEDFKPEKVGVYVHDAANLNLMLISATAIAEKNNAKVILNAYLPEKHNKRQKARVDKMMIESLQTFNSPALYQINVNISNNPLENLILESASLDVLIVGTEQLGNENKFEHSLPFQLARRAHCSVILVKSVSRFKRLLKSI